MKKEDTLRKIKEVEAQVRRSKDDALAEREKVVRAARREVLDLKDALRLEAEKRYDAILKAAEDVIARERASLLEGGRKEAAALTARAHASMEPAVARLIAKFKGAVNA